MDGCLKNQAHNIVTNATMLQRKLDRNFIVINNE